jgi:hypothetical protein
MLVPTLSRFRLALVAWGMGLAIVAVAGLALVDTRPMHVKASEWAEHNRLTLPQHLSELATYPVSYRRAAFKLYSPELRAKMWREHLSRVVAERPLNSDQQQIVEDLIATLTPELYTRENPEASPHFDSIRY